MLPLLALLVAAQAAAPAPAPKGPVVAMETTMGTIRIALDKEKAPLSTANFLAYVNADFYDGTIIHRYDANFVFQGGGYVGPVAAADNPVHKPTNAPIALELKVIGLMNVQFAIQKGEVYILEVNPRDSRTIPFVSKAIGVPLAKLAAITPDPAGAWRNLDPIAIRGLAALELRSAGVRVRLRR